MKNRPSQMGILTSRVESDGGAKDFHYEVGHWDAQGRWNTLVVSGNLFPTYRSAKDQADAQIRGYEAAMRKAAQRTRLALSFPAMIKQGGVA